MRRYLALVAVAAVLAGCGATGSPATEPPATVPPVTTTSATTSAPVPSAPATTSTTPAPGTRPPPWLGTRVLPVTEAGFGVQRPTPRALRERRFTLPDTMPELPGTGFASRIADPAPAAVIARSTWAPGCPVAATDLAWIRLTFWGFDDRRHTGELLVNSAAATDLVAVFRSLYDDRFPIEQMRITTKAEQTAPPTGDGNDTGSFNCRPVRGATTYSQHAYGLAVDVNPFQNPYQKGSLVLPELAGSYTDRTWKRPGMILPDGPVVRAFTAIGWTWGGTWRSLKDLQHFSRSGG
ncbi:M15 family peptidase [Nocardioides marmoriginsengisoli]|uniref:M15 family peptidase n=1 Tax=Nocardioides marmoriginsengisoli TaxID=661483 RepID=A0A3N0CC03_9ACTN|nr:M15 family metallopeptidase [Nocardioides marmoriginsengisoli]RNL60596.1 M15 family peptidase [Nocardioides marmoriginsengisoli]